MRALRLEADGSLVQHADLSRHVGSWANGLVIVMPFVPKPQVEDLNKRIEDARLTLDQAQDKAPGKGT